MSKPFDLSRQFITQILEVVLEHGFEPPLYVTVVATNGHMMYIKFEPFVERDGLEASLLATHGEDFFPLAINIMVTDANGKAVHVVVDSKWEAPRFMFNGGM